MTSTRTAQILSDLAQDASAVADSGQRLATACTEALRVTGVGLVLMSDAGPAGTVAATDGPAATMEELQFTLGEGPCVDSSRTGRPVLAPELARSGPRRWPAFSPPALEAGIQAIFAFPLGVGGIRVGVLDLYRDSAGALSDAELAEALSYADAATTVLLDLQAQDSPEGAGAGVVPVIWDRAEVHQATGMVAVQAEVPLAQALVLLRARAFAAERPIHAVAHDVLAGAVRFTSDPGGRIREY